eukprot:190446-Pleurochrysis_carterae.AAC.1
MLEAPSLSPPVIWRRPSNLSGGRCEDARDPRHKGRHGSGPDTFGHRPWPYRPRCLAHALR